MLLTLAPHRLDEIHRVSAVLQATGASPWAAGVAETILTISGRIRLLYLTAFCTETLVGANTIQVGTSSDTNGLIPATNKASIVANDWWIGAILQLPGIFPIGADQKGVVVSEDIELLANTNDATDGTLVFTAFYILLTADGRLV